jgi:hypothetical protein
MAYTINLKKKVVVANDPVAASHALFKAWERWLERSAIARKGGKVPLDLMASRNAVVAATRHAQKAGVTSDIIREIQQIAQTQAAARVHR